MDVLSCQPAERIRVFLLFQPGETAHKLQAALWATQHLVFGQNDLKHGGFGLQRTDALNYNGTTCVF